ncbi:MAG: YlxR family protein [Pseudanabaenaceae cyanobacterium bins.39]|nr:YlxR family protein [Pseudanabaenaceae cyanobacterium bins.39]
MALKLERRCVSCHCVAPRDRFWRIVRVPMTKTDGERSPDAQKFTIQLDHGMGRSAYLCPNASCLQIAQKKNRLGRALRMPIPPEVLEVLRSRLANQSTDQ